MLSRLLTFATDKIYNLPILVIMPHSRCNCRCVMCDIWKANNNKKEITAEQLQKHIEHFTRLGVREIVFSGGEALMHSNLWKLCSLLRGHGIEMTLLSTGLLLEKNAVNVLENFREVIVSVDGSQAIHDRIRNIPQGFEKLAAGIKALKQRRPGYRVTARCVLQRHNFSDFENIVSAVKAIGVDQISFLAADISTAAFNHTDQLTAERISDVALDATESLSFEKIIDASFVSLKDDYDTKFIAESPDKMRRIVQYYKAINRAGDFPGARCNAPWVSAVIESDGRVMPCFFHEPYGNIHDGDLESIINSPAAIGFRRQLDVKKDPVCKKCVCSLKLGVREMN